MPSLKELKPAQADPCGRLGRVHVWASYIIQAEGAVEALAKVQKSLNPEEEDNSAYFGLSTDDNMDCEGSHFGDNEVSVHFYPTTHERTYFVVLVGQANGLKNPSITPPLIDDDEAVEWNSIKGTRAEALQAALPKAFR